MYSIRVRATDQGGASYEKLFTITVGDVNESPTDLSLSPATVAENLPSGTLVGTLSSSDPDTANSFTYALVAGEADNSSFSILNGQSYHHILFSERAAW